MNMWRLGTRRKSLKYVEIRQSFWKTTLEENGIMPYEIYKVNFKNKNNQKENKWKKNLIGLKIRGKY